MKDLSEFTNLYSLSKTLKFELKPVGETVDKIEEFKNRALYDVVKRDEKRAFEYEKMKTILDDYYRDFIDKVLKQKIFSDAEIKNTFNTYKKTKQQNADKDKFKKEFQSIQKKFRVKIAKALKENLKEAGLDEYSTLINEKGKGDNLSKPLLWHWLNKRLSNNEITNDEFNEAEKTLKSFDKFSTYFTGFKDNRDNMFSEKDQTTAISYRIVHENMIKHFDNCMRLENIKSKYKDLYKEFKDVTKEIKPESLNMFLNQNGIDTYNSMIGGDSIDQNKTGINQKINLYRQNHKLSGKEIPFMAKLYKQILSKSESKFIIDEFDNHEEMLNAINEYYHDVLISKNIDNIEKLLVGHIRSDSKNIYIKNDQTIAGISNILFKDWSFIKRALEKLAESRIQNKNNRDKWLKSDIFNLFDIQAAINMYLEEIEEKDFVQTDIASYFTSLINNNGKIVDNIYSCYKKAEGIIKTGKFNDKNNDSDEKSDTDKIKDLLDSIMGLIHFLKPFHLFKKGKPIDVDNTDSDFYEPFNIMYNELCILIPLYNKSRNFLTKKPYLTDKIKINFDNGFLLTGWSQDYDTKAGLIFIKGNRYYLAINDKKLSDDEKFKLKENYEQNPARRIILDFQKPDKKNVPRLFIRSKGENFAPAIEKYKLPIDNVLEIYDKGLFKTDYREKNPTEFLTSLHKLIDYFKIGFTKHESYKHYSFKWKPTNQYKDIAEFYNDVIVSCYQIKDEYINWDTLINFVDEGKMYLFEIYNKDFSKYSKGTPNLHTLFWKALFSEENLKDVVIKLNGKAEIFFRKASVKNKVIHKAGEAIESKNPLNKKRSSTFDYDIVKDRRFTKDKFFFHCPITLNFKAQGISRFNEKVNSYLENNNDIKFIGIDRGERHLLYYSIIDSRGSIIEQNTLNILKNTYKTDIGMTEKETDYHALLNKKEKERESARVLWSTIENIKELKSGYLSHIVHEIAQLMIKHNAVVILEDLNFGFKRGRFKIEKQVYQKFEKALIQKLNYLVFKNKEIGESGHLLKAYQLTDEFVSFDTLGKQSGFLFYVPAGYTSKIDPATGFINLLDTRYYSIEKSIEFFSKFDSIRYNKNKDYFEFSFDYKYFTDRAGGNTKWTVCSYGKERYCYNSREKSSECHNVTENLKVLFGHLGFENCDDIRGEIINQSEAGFFIKLYFNLKLLLALRYTGKDINNIEVDYILSPVKNATGNFFDSRELKKNMPLDADANGAYHIALKGMMTIKGIKDGKLPKIEKGKMNKEWFEFAQYKNYN